MAEYCLSSLTSTLANFIDQSPGDHFCEQLDDGACASSNGSSVGALPSELGAKSWVNSDCDFRISSASDGQNGLSAASSADQRGAAVQQNGRDIPNIFSLLWSDSDDDFSESKYNIPLSQRVRSTCDDSTISRPFQPMSGNSQPAGISSRVPSRREQLPVPCSLEQLGAELSSASGTKQSHDPTDNPSNAADEMDSFGFFDDLSSTKHNKLNRGETTSRNACKKKKFTKFSHKSRTEYPDGLTLSSSHPSSFVTEDAQLPSGSKTKQPTVQIASTLADDDDDEFRVFFDDLCPARQRRKKLDHGVTSSHNAQKKKKFPKLKHKSSMVYPSSTLSSSGFTTSAIEHSPDAGGTSNKVNADITTGIWDNTLDIVSSGDIFGYCAKPKDTNTFSSSSSCSDDKRVLSSGAEGITKRRQFRQKRQISDDDCLNKTFDILSAEHEQVNLASHFQSTSTAIFNESTSTSALERPKIASSSELRKEKSTRMPSYDAALHSGAILCENSCISDMDVDRVNVQGGGLTDSDCRDDYQDRTAVTTENLSAIVSSLSAVCAGTLSDAASNPNCWKRFYPVSLLGSDSGSNVVHEAKVEHSLADRPTCSGASCMFNHPEYASTYSSASSVFNQPENEIPRLYPLSSLDGDSTSSIIHEATAEHCLASACSSVSSMFNQLEYAKKDEPRGNSSRYLSSAAVENSHERSSTADGMNAQGTSDSYHLRRQNRYRLYSHDTADGRLLLKTAAVDSASAVSSGGCLEKGRLKRRALHVGSDSSGRLRNTTPVANATAAANSDGSEKGHVKRRVSHGRGDDNGRVQKTTATAAVVSRDGSGKGRLKRRALHDRRFVSDKADEDDNGGEGLACSHGENLDTDTRTSHRAAEPAVSLLDDVVIIDSDDDKSVPAEDISPQDVDSTDGQQRSDVKPNVTADGNSGSVCEVTSRRLGQRRTARMSCPGTQHHFFDQRCLKFLWL